MINQEKKTIGWISWREIRFSEEKRRRLVCV